MDKTILKNFAVESRKDLMEKMRRKISLYYIDEKFDKSINGDVVVLSNDKHSITLTKEQSDNRDNLVKRINELGIEQVIEESAYTWFNRLVAIRYMEINDYLPLTKDNQSLGFRVLSSQDNTLDPEILKFTNLSNTSLDIDFNPNKYSSLTNTDEKFKYVLLLVCKKLGKVIPQVFDGITDYIDLLIPDNLLSIGSVLDKLIKIPEDNFKEVEVIGWLYQYYISEKKEEVDEKVQKKERIVKEELPAKTQLFTPDWIVKYMVQNTILNLSKANNNTDEFKYYINDNYSSNNKNIEEIKFIDPCCGSGHILVYCFEILYKIYEFYGYSKNDIPELILKNNLYGLDIDDRAGQLSILSVILKARKYDKNIFLKNINVNICSIQESNNIDLSFFELSSSNEKILKYLIDTFNDAKEYGSLIDVKKEDYDKLLEEINETNNIFVISLKNRIMQLINQANIMSQEYDVVVTNPPYLGVGNVSTKLNNYMKKNYPDSKNDMFATFIEKCQKLTIANGYYALITQPSILFLNYFENLRKKIISKNTIISLLHMGRGIFGVDFGSAAFVIKKAYDENYKGSYYRLHKKVFQLIELENIEKIFLMTLKNDKLLFDFDKLNETNNLVSCIGTGEQIFFSKNQASFNDIPGTPFAYWISNNIGNAFKNNLKVKDVAEPRAGMQTGENEKFVRYWYEVQDNKIGFDVQSANEAINSHKKWFRYNKGGFFRKWYGNNEFVVDWENDGKNIKEDKLYKLSIGKCLESNSKPKNMQYYFKESLTWSFVSSNAFSIRYSPAGAIFDIAGSSVFPKKDDIYYLLGFLASNISMEFMKLQNPTLNFQVGNVSNLPVIFDINEKENVEAIVKDNILLAKEDWDSFETSWDFKEHPIIRINKDLWDATAVGASIQKYYGKHLDVSCPLELCWLLYNGQCNEKFNQLKSNEEELNNIFDNIYKINNEFSTLVDDKDVTIRKSDKLRDIKSFISYAVGCMFGRYSLDEEGLIYAGGEWNKSRYKTFIPDNDNIIPIADSNDIFYIDDIVGKFIKFVEITFGKDTIRENLDYIAETLGKKGIETSEETIRRYFLNDFYKDHLQTYQKRPIYWMFDSGKSNGFKCLIYMHRYNEQTISKIKVDYFLKVQESYRNQLTAVQERLNGVNGLTTVEIKELRNKEKDLTDKLKECKDYYEKLDHIANEMIKIDLDYGVKVNYAKFEDILAKNK